MRGAAAALLATCGDAFVAAAARRGADDGAGANVSGVPRPARSAKCAPVLPRKAPASNLTAATCYCNEGVDTLYPGESLGMSGSGCAMGSCTGSPFVGHAEGATVKSLTMWPHGGYGDWASAISWTLTNGDVFTQGTTVGRGGACATFDFDPGDYLAGDVLLSGIIHDGDDYGRVAGMGFTVIKQASGHPVTFSCGNLEDKFVNHFPAEGRVFTGFYGWSGSDLDELGFLHKQHTCNVVSREIIAIHCVDPTSGTDCGAEWADGGETQTAHAICDACDTSQPVSCDATFQVTNTNEITSASTKIDTLGGSVTIGSEFSVGFLGTGGKATASVTVDYSHTWESSKSQTKTVTNTIGSQCTMTPQPHMEMVADALLHVGKMKADIVLTVRSTNECGEKTTFDADASVTIANVPLTSAITSCTFHDVACAVSAPATAAPPAPALRR